MRILLLLLLLAVLTWWKRRCQLANIYHCHYHYHHYFLWAFPSLLWLCINTVVHCVNITFLLYFSRICPWVDVAAAATGRVLLTSQDFSAAVQTAGSAEATLDNKQTWCFFQSNIQTICHLLVGIHLFLFISVPISVKFGISGKLSSLILYSL